MWEGSNLDEEMLPSKLSPAGKSCMLIRGYARLPIIKKIRCVSQSPEGSYYLIRHTERQPWEAGYLRTAPGSNYLIGVAVYRGADTLHAFRANYVQDSYISLTYIYGKYV